MRYQAAVRTVGVDVHPRPLGTYDTAIEAWRALADYRRAEEDAVPTDTDEYSEIWKGLDYIASGEHAFGDPHDDWGLQPQGVMGTRPSGVGFIAGDNPALWDSMGESPSYDKGIDYIVNLVED